MKSGLLSWLVAGALLLAALPAAAEEPAFVRLALVIGVNRSVDSAVPELRFADDDAGRYFDLFSALGIETVVLTRMDANTAALHPKASGRARPPRAKELGEGVALLAARATAARKAGSDVALYFVYAGHGSIESGVGKIALEDARLSGTDLERRVLDEIAPKQSHFIVDACNSYYLAYARGPGGQHRQVSGFSDLGALGKRSDVGVLLSTSSARESHEWERVQAGVFSHEVRSGLYGAADADGDGRISYREIAAFVDRANARIPNERFRPQLYARPPQGGETLLDLRSELARRVEVSGQAPAHYVLEDPQGVQVLEFHNAPGERVHFFRPVSFPRFFLRRLPDEKEFLIQGDGVVETAKLELREPSQRARGAAHEAFSRTFELPFGADSVRTFHFPAVSPDAAAPDGALPEKAAGSLRRPLGFGLLGLSAAGIGVGSIALYSAHQEKKGASADESQTETAERNRRIHTLNWTSGIAFATAGAAAAAGLTLLLWPESPVELQTAGADGAFVDVHGTF